MSEQGFSTFTDAAPPHPIPAPFSGQGDVPLSDGGPSVVFIAVAAGFVAALTFSAFPGVDLFFARLFYTGDGQFLGAPGGLVEGLRFVIRKLFFLAALGVAAGFILSALTSFRLIDFSFARWAFLALALFLGPLLAVGGAKELWGRARPYQIQTFGGSSTFSPPLARSGQCSGDCSFVSRETAKTFTIILAPAFFLIGRRRREVMAAAIAAGAFTGLLRMMAGGHFLSDVLFAMVFCALTTSLAYQIVFRWRPEWFADQGPIRLKMISLAQKVRSEGPAVYGRLRSRLGKGASAAQ